MPRVPLTFSSPLLLTVSLALVVLLAIIAIRRRPALARTSKLLAILAAILLALAAGGMNWRRPASSEITVMVDLSPSTRTAAYRTRAALDARINQLLAGAPYRIVYFSDRNTAAAPGDATGPLPDLPSERTIFAPPAAPAILLFSDGRFALPRSAPPTFIVADPNLDQPTDAAVLQLQARSAGGGIELAATIRVNAPPGPNVTPRRLTIAPASTQPTILLDPAPDPITLSRPLKAGPTLASATIARGDAWPENDSLTLPIAPPARGQRWFVSSNATAPAGDWQPISPARLPPANDPAYLAPSVIFLDNLPASSLSNDQQRALEQYVRDLGGALVIAGGDHAFSAGLYPGSTLEALSPLASSPPQPTTHWMLLADSSGSMSQVVFGSTTRWQLASSAIVRLLPSLPPEDPVSIGSFAAELNWWSTGRRARDAAGLSLPPAGAGPNGPTNLQPALERIIKESDGSTPTELLVLSDADTTIDRPADLATRLKAKKIRLHLLAIGEGTALEALRTITQTTGGSLLTQFSDPAKWSAEVHQLLSAAFPSRLSADPTPATFLADLSKLPARPVAPWNRTWLKESATLLAETRATTPPAPLAARRTLGGEVVALAFAPSPEEIEAIAHLIARPPRDPRFTIFWDPASQLKVRIDAAERAATTRPNNGTNNAPAYLNNLQLTLSIEPQDPIDNPQSATRNIPIAQTAPGRYEAAIDSPRVPSFAAIRLGGQTLDRIALPGRYAAEFDQVGNDYDAMHALAARTGGQVIDRTMTKALEIPYPRQEVSLTPMLALMADGLVAVGLIRWRWA